MPGLTAAQMLAVAREAQNPPANTDADWKTARQWGRESGHTTEYARRTLTVGEANGTFKRERRYASAGPRVMLVDHWKFMGKAK